MFLLFISANILLFACTFLDPITALQLLLKSCTSTATLEVNILLFDAVMLKYACSYGLNVCNLLVFVFQLHVELENRIYMLLLFISVNIYCCSLVHFLIRLQHYSCYPKLPFSNSCIRSNIFVI